MLEVGELLGNLAALGLLSLPDALSQGQLWGRIFSLQPNAAIQLLSVSNPGAAEILASRYASLLRTTLLRMGHPYAICMTQVASPRFCGHVRLSSTASDCSQLQLMCCGPAG